MADIRNVQDMNGLIAYFSENLGWDIDLADFDDIEDISYDFSAADIGLKEEAFAKIATMRQLQPMTNDQKWGIFCIEFESNRFEVSAMRKILSGLIPRRRASVDHAVWQQQDLLFICNWGEGNNRTIGLAHFEEREKGLPQIKMISCAPALEDFTQIKHFEDSLKQLSWPRNPSDIEAWRQQWSSAFSVAYREVIHTSSALTVRLAAEAQNIRNQILAALEVELENGYVHQLYDKFKKTLIHDMTETAFADMYAQTVVYGLFSARCMDRSQENFSIEEAIDCIPNTNPFLKNLMRECIGAEATSHMAFDELDIGNVVDLLAHTNTEAIIRDFNRQTGGGREDPVIHFYEEFLTAYDKAQKVQRGVYYTPQPVVNFIVRAVDDILKTEFGYADGLASTDIKDIKIRRKSKKKNERGLYSMVEDTESIPAVQVLDPATGTGTFIRQVILQIYENFLRKHQGKSEAEIKKLWNEYVPEHLLHRINAFELMMAPYAVAHMKLAMVLRDTGYEFGTATRLNVCLTNTLEPAGDDDEQMTFWSDPLAMESIEANKVKKNRGISVILGNPPYSGESANKGPFIMSLMEDYKKEPGGQIKLQERNPKWINDDYVKFIRYAQQVIDEAGEGILAYICPHGFLSNPTFRGMRWKLLQSFSKVYIIDLHGNYRKSEVSPDGSKDENVFDIQQGVCIVIAIKQKRTARDTCLLRMDSFGLRKQKYEWLSCANIKNIPWQHVSIDNNSYIFEYRNTLNQSKYTQGFGLEDVFIVNSMGVTTGNDSIVVDENYDRLYQRISRIANAQISDLEIATEFFSGKQKGVTEFRNKILGIDPAKYIKRVCYRPFDKRYLFYYPEILARPRVEIMNNMCSVPNLALCVIKINRDEHFLPFVTDGITDKTVLSSKDNANIFPLFMSQNDAITERIVSNLRDEFIKILQKKLDCSFVMISGDLHETRCFNAIDVFDYIYAILYSSKYNTAFCDQLRTGFPRIPYPVSSEYFFKLGQLGKQLRSIHLLSDAITVDEISYSGDGNDRIDAFCSYKQRMFINDTQYFSAPNEAVWDSYIADYQPLRKWLKDRKGQTLTSTDIEHYKQMIQALIETQRIMREIDEVIEL